MPAPDAITVYQLARLVGLPDAPSILEVRSGQDFGADPRSLPGAMRRDWRTASFWAAEYAGRSITVVCHRGLKLSQGVAAWLRHAGADAARPGLAPEAPGLLAASLGLSRMHKDDLAQLDAGLALYDAFYSWARDALAGTHNWPAPVPAAEGRRVRETAP